VARFSNTPVAIRLRLDDRDLDAWTQSPRGWSVRVVDLGEHRGPLRFQFRSEGPDELGVAIDWAEIREAGGLVPERSRLLRLGLLLLAASMLAGLALGWLGALGALALLLLGFGVGVWRDPLGAVSAFSAGAPAALCVLALLVAFVRLLRRAWPDATLGPAAVAPALAGATAAALLLSHPFFYYPDVTSHARFVAALRADPYLAWDPSDYQKSTDTWAMREIAGQRVAFPYSPVFHLAALPLGPLLGEIAAVKAVAATALGVSLLLVHLLARAAALPEACASAAQVALFVFPVTASRLSLALFPTLLGQATDLLLVVHLARRYPLLSGARDAAWLFFFLFLAQAAYTASLFNVALLVAFFGARELWDGDRAKARRLLGAFAASLLLVVALQYARFLPVLLRDVLPHATSGSTAMQAGAGPIGRFVLFFGLLTPALALIGLLVPAPAPRHVRCLLGALLAAGGVMLTLRYAVPGVFRDAKEIELLAPTLAVLSAGGLAAVAARGRSGRVAAAAMGLGLLAWGTTAGYAAWARRFIAVGLGS
jgi:hypothetical protein